MKKNLLILFLIVLTLINVAALVTIAYHRFYPRKPFPLPPERTDTPVGFIKQELDLSEEQVEKFEAHFRKIKGEMEPIFDSLRAKRTKLMDEVSVEQPNMDKVNTLTEEIANLQIELQKKAIMHMLEEKSFLTPEQQKKFFTFFRERADLMRMGGMPGEGTREEPFRKRLEDRK